MADNFRGMRRVSGGPLASRRRLPLTIAVVIACFWGMLLVLFRSLVVSSIVLLMLAVFGGICLVALRSLGVDRRHPFIRSLASRPWRNGRRVFRLALQDLSKLFIVTPMGSQIAPSAVEVRMNPADLASLNELVDLDLARELALEAYEAHIAAASARILNDGPIRVAVVADPDLSVGRYAVRQCKQPASQVSSGVGGGRHDGFTRRDIEAARTRLTGYTTAAAPEPGDPPLLRLITGIEVVQTRMSGARAGRSRAAELSLPNVPTISRLHARFTYEQGEWRVTSLGRNGVVVNDEVVLGQRTIHDNDLIRWGRQSDALTSRIAIS